MRLLGSVLAFLFVVCVSRAQSPSSSCSGAFDFFFIVDRSYSLRNDYATSIVPFVEKVADFFVNPDFRLSIITFDYMVDINLPLTPTSDREAVQAGIESMKNVDHNTGTWFPSALDVALTQVPVTSDTVTIFLGITDGMWTGKLDKPLEKMEEQDILRFIVGIGEDIVLQQMTDFTGSIDNVFIGNDFNYLQEIIDKVVNRTCVEVTSFIPSKLCFDRDTTTAVNLGGRGFTINLDPSRAACRFKTDSGYITTRPVGEITNNHMACEDPGINKTGEYELKITLDGIKFVTSSVKLVVDDCKDDEDGGGGGGGGGRGGGGGGGGVEVDAGLVVGILFGIIGLILLILLCCLWIFFPIITCRIVGGLPPEPEEKEPEPKPGRKWEIVDASYYGGGGVGGIKPVTVKWGKGGSTEQGNKLTKAKDAEVMEVVEEPGVPAPPPKGPPGCWDKFKKKLKRWYAVASSYRPVWGPTKHVLWFPGTKPDDPNTTTTHKPAAARTARSTPAPLRAGSSSAFLLPENGSVSSPVRSPPPPPPPSYTPPTRTHPPPPPRPSRPPAPPRPPALNPSRPAPPRPGNSS